MLNIHLKPTTTILIAGWISIAFCIALFFIHREVVSFAGGFLVLAGMILNRLFRDSEQKGNFEQGFCALVQKSDLRLMDRIRLCVDTQLILFGLVILGVEFIV